MTDPDFKALADLPVIGAGPADEIRIRQMQDALRHAAERAAKDHAWIVGTDLENGRLQARIAELEAAIRDNDYATITCDDIDAHETLMRAKIGLARIVKLREAEIDGYLKRIEELEAALTEALKDD